MKKMIIAAALVVTLAAPAAASEWYLGGTLARASLGQRASASGADQLASAANAVTFLNQKQGKRIHPRDTKPESRQLARCISVIAADSRTHSVAVSDATYGCFIELGWF